MKDRARLLLLALPLLQPLQAQDAAKADDPDAHPPVAQVDLQIVKRAHEILNSPAKWNRADTRVCAAEASTFSMYCALEKTTKELEGKFEHRGAAMQEAPFRDR